MMFNHRHTETVLCQPQRCRRADHTAANNGYFNWLIYHKSLSFIHLC
jgi:hypothetical protein